MIVSGRVAKARSAPLARCRIVLELLAGMGNRLFSSTGQPPPQILGQTGVSCLLTSNRVYGYAASLFYYQQGREVQALWRRSLVARRRQRRRGRSKTFCGETGCAQRDVPQCKVTLSLIDIDEILLYLQEEAWGSRNRLGIRLAEGESSISIRSPRHKA